MSLGKLWNDTHMIYPPITWEGGTGPIRDVKWPAHTHPGTAAADLSPRFPDSKSSLCAIEQNLNVTCELPVAVDEVSIIL